MPSWPATLPEFNADSYSEEDADGLVRTQMDAGPEFRRRRFTAVPTRITTSLLLTDTQTDTLLTFYRDTLAGGSLPFDWDHPRTEASVSMRFNSFPTIAGGPFNFRVSLDLEILP